MRKRRQFLLLEVLIALALLSLCLIPLFAPHIEITKQEVALYEATQLREASGRIFAKLSEQLYTEQKTLQWEQFACSPYVTTLSDPVVISYPGKRERLWHCSYTLSLEETTKNESGHAGLLKVAIHLNPGKTASSTQSFVYWLVVKTKTNVL